MPVGDLVRSVESAGKAASTTPASAPSGGTTPPPLRVVPTTALGPSEQSKGAVSAPASVPRPPKPVRQRRWGRWLIGLAGFAALAALGAGGYWYYRWQPFHATDRSTNPSSAPALPLPEKGEVVTWRGEPSFAVEQEGSDGTPQTYVGFEVGSDKPFVIRDISPEFDGLLGWLSKPNFLWDVKSVTFGDTALSEHFGRLLPDLEQHVSPLGFLKLRRGYPQVIAICQTDGAGREVTARFAGEMKVPTVDPQANLWYDVCPVFEGAIVAPEREAPAPPKGPAGRRRPRGPRGYRGTGTVFAYQAARAGDVRDVLKHFSGGVPVDARDLDGWTLLHWAVDPGRLGMARLLISKGADVNAKADDGKTPLHLAAQNGYLRIAELLIAKGADANAPARTLWGATPLQLAAIGGNARMVQLLLAKGADANAVDDFTHSTALQLATRYQHQDVVNLLRQHGATE